MSQLRLTIFALLIIIRFTSIAQPVYFQLAFGDSLTQSMGKSVVQGNDGSIYFSGNFNNSATTTQGIELTKLDSAGNILWQKKITTGYAYVNKSIRTNYGSILMIGQLTDSSGNTNALAIATDTSGSIIFSKIYGNVSTTESFQGLIQTADGGFIFSGFITNPSGPGNAFWVLKSDSVGNEEWQQTYNYNVNSVSDDIVQSSDGGYVISGDKKTASSNYNAHVIKIDSVGTIQWETDLTFQYNSGCKNLIINNHGYYIIIGEAATATSAYFDPFISKLDTGGNIIWSHTIPCSNSTDAGYDIIEPAPDNYLITGMSYNTNALTTDLYVMRLDSIGDEVSRRYYGDNGYDQGYSIIKDYKNMGFLAAGFITLGAENKYFLVHDDLLGIPSSISTSPINSAFNVFPNPANDELYFNADAFTEDAILKIYNLLGKLVSEKKMDGINSKINTSNLNDGLYFIEISDQNHVLKSKVVICH